MNDGLNVEDESKTPVEQWKCIFWQTSINNHRPKISLYTWLFMEGLLDMGADVSTITPESWHLN